jgi:hypothetical protein
VDLPSEMLFLAISRASWRAISMCAGSWPGEDPQYTAILTLLSLVALGFRGEGVEVRGVAAMEGIGDTPPDCILRGVPLVIWFCIR